MQPLKKLSLLCFGLTLLVGLGSFSGVELQPQIEGVKTTLVVGQSSNNSRFSISFQKASESLISCLNNQVNFSFYAIRLFHSHNQVTAFKSYTNKAFNIKFKKLHSEVYALYHNKTFYHNHIV